MNFKQIYIAAICLAALAVGAGKSFAAAEPAEADGLFNRPLLSRFLPNFSGKSELLSSSPSSNARFHLSFFTAGSPQPAATEESAAAASYLSQLPALHTSTGIADLDYGPYYGASRVNLTSFAGDSTGSAAVGFPQQLRNGSNLSLNLEAGGRLDDLNAGLLYAYHSNHTTRDIKHGAAPYPMYIFTPVTSTDGLVEEHSHDSHGVFLYVGYNLTRQLNVRGTLGMAKTTSRPGEESNVRLGEQSRRWGVDLAATYRLLDNLVYEAHLGYVSIDNTSSSATSITTGTSDATPLSSDGPPTSIYQIGSHIRMTF